MTEVEKHIPAMRRRYKEHVIPALQTRFAFTNHMQVPKLQKIVLNMGVGEASRDAKILQRAMEDLALICGQKPRRNSARVSVSQFKIREGMPVGCSVTLRGAYMYEFLERLISIAIPRIRDFRGLPNKFDGRGNYSFGLKEHQVFLELDLNKDFVSLGMDLSFVTSAATDDQCRWLLKEFGMPLRDTDKS